MPISIVTPSPTSFAEYKGIEIGNSKADNGNVHRAAAKIIVSKSRAARGSVCNVLLSGDAWCLHLLFKYRIQVFFKFV